MHKNASTRRALIAVTLATPFLSLTAQAQRSEWPNRPVRVVLPWPPGGGADTTARMIFPKLGQKLGQPFVIENRPGASGNIATEITANAIGESVEMVCLTAGTWDNTGFIGTWTAEG